MTGSHEFDTGGHYYGADPWLFSPFARDVLGSWWERRYEGTSSIEWVTRDLEMWQRYRLDALASFPRAVISAPRRGARPTFSSVDEISEWARACEVTDETRALLERPFDPVDKARLYRPPTGADS